MAGIEEAHNSDRLSDLIDPEKDQIASLGIMGLGIDQRTQAVLPNLRGAYGVFVAARSEVPVATATGLQIGGVIHELNGVMMPTVAALRAGFELMKRGDPVALFIEREGKLLYVAFELE